VASTLEGARNPGSDRYPTRRHSRSPRGSGSSSSRDDGVRSARHRGRRDGLPRAARATRHAARRFTTRPRSPGALTHHVTGIASSRTSSRTRPVPRAGVPQWPGGSRQRPGGSRATKAASESAMKDEVGTTAGCFIMVVRPDSGDVHRGMGPIRASGSERHGPAPGEKFARIGASWVSDSVPATCSGRRSRRILAPTTARDRKICTRDRTAEATRHGRAAWWTRRADGW
jgi:hypothetical protein